MGEWRLEAAIAEVAARHPDRVAITGGAVSLTMAELEHAAAVLAARIAAACPPEGRFIAVAAASVTSFAVAALAVLKAGRAYVPIDLRYPLKRAAELLESGIADLVVADPSLPHGAAPAGVAVLGIDVADLKRAPMPEPRPAGMREAVAYVCFTSGSTGKPKGVLVGHAGIEGLTVDPGFPVFRAGGRTAQVTTFAFDSTTLEVWGSLLNGSVLVEVPPALMLSPAGIAGFLARERITAAWLSTGYFHVLLEHDPTMFAGMDTLVIGGEAADAGSIARMFAAGRPPRRLVNGYGPTEATTLGSWHLITAEDAAAGVIPIGRAMAGRRLVVVDGDMRPVPAGTDGELLIAGPAVAFGYWDAPERTAERFLPDPEAPGGLMYRTGDLCRFRDDGVLLYLGRIDDQVKVRGFRVEPAHVARELTAIAGVEEAVVLPRPTRTAGRELIGFVRGAPGLDGAAVRAALGERLADFMVPSVVVPVEAFPLGANGKLDRAALLARAAPERGVGAPATPTEARVMAVLGASSPAARLAEIAPDSLAMVDVLIRLERAFGREVPPAVLAGDADIATVAAWLETAAAAAAAGPANDAGARAFMVALPWALQPLPEVVTAAIAEGAALEVIPLPAEALNGGGCAIAAMAAHVLERIERRAADGPLVLTGYSIAGIVAASVAAELAARGRTVERLVLIDADFGRHSLRRRMARRIGRLVRRRAAAAMAAPVGALVARARRSAMGWTPPRLAMPVVAVHSTDPGVVNAANWARWCDGPVRVERVAGGHLELIRNPAVSARVAMAIAGAAEVARAA